MLRKHYLDQPSGELLGIAMKPTLFWGESSDTFEVFALGNSCDERYEGLWLLTCGGGLDYDLDDDVLDMPWLFVKLQKKKEGTKDA